MNYLLVLGTTVDLIGAVVLAFPDLSNNRLKKQVYQRIPGICVLESSRENLMKKTDSKIVFEEERYVVVNLYPVLVDEFDLDPAVDPSDIDYIEIDSSNVVIWDKRGKQWRKSEMVKRRVGNRLENRIRQKIIRTGLILVVSGTLLVFSGSLIGPISIPF